jgi:hypothetical protein
MRKEESMSLTLPETYENERTSKYHEYTDTKVSGYIAVVFVTKKSFSVLTRHVFQQMYHVCTITCTCK